MGIDAWSLPRLLPNAPIESGGDQAAVPRAVHLARVHYHRCHRGLDSLPSRHTRTSRDHAVVHVLAGYTGDLILSKLLPFDCIVLSLYGCGALSGTRCKMV